VLSTLSIELKKCIGQSGWSGLGITLITKMNFHKLSHVEIPQSATYNKDPASNPMWPNESMNLAAIKPHKGISCCA
jgi:hypothetical protein